MSLVPLTITKGDASTVTLNYYKAAARNVASAVTAAATVGASPIIRTPGDHKEHVTSLEFDIEVTGATLAAAYSAAYALIEDAAAAASVEWHQGTVNVLALRNATLAASGPSEVRVHLAWWPAHAGVTPPSPPYSGSS